VDSEVPDSCYTFGSGDRVSLAISEMHGLIC
jgi:hypothetical protein